MLLFGLSGTWFLGSTMASSLLFLYNYQIFYNILEEFYYSPDSSPNFTHGKNKQVCVWAPSNRSTILSKLLMSAVWSSLK